MRSHSLAQAAILLASSGPLRAAAAPETGVLEIDLVFPRNETYAPTDQLPIIFAFRNAPLAQYLDFDRIHLDLVGDKIPASNNKYTLSHHHVDIRVVNWTTTPATYYAYTYLNNFTSPRDFNLAWYFDLGHCHLPNFTFADVPQISRRGEIDIRIAANGGRSASDLVAATADASTCNRGASNRAVAFNITSTIPVPEWARGPTWNSGDTCGVVDPEEEVVAEPCKVGIDEAAAASMAAERRCHMANDTEACSAGSIVGSPVGLGAAVTGWWCVAAVLGAAGFLMG